MAERGLSRQRFEIPVLTPQGAKSFDMKSEMNYIFGIIILSLPSSEGK